ncbi:hypothetical protein BDN67DRAFT_1037634 [Paxillus ammoniavirescens]|nr:hypothetical protein BDN67DRAFT_1037634 [Paxillus ammoniavirescens]
MSNDLIIYTRDLGRIITIAYPLSPNGVRIIPGGVFKWMERCRLILKCFCALVSGQPTPAHFVNKYLSRHTIVRCHHINNQCGFHLNVMNIHVMTLLESAYWHIPTTSFGNPDMQVLLARWHQQVCRDPSLLQCQAPYFDGYFGIHISIYPDIRQLHSSLQQPLVLLISARCASHNMYHCHRSININNRLDSYKSYITGVDSKSVASPPSFNHKLTSQPCKAGCSTLENYGRDTRGQVRVKIQ